MTVAIDMEAAAITGIAAAAQDLSNKWRHLKAEAVGGPDKCNGALEGVVERHNGCGHKAIARYAREFLGSTIERAETIGGPSAECT